MTYRERQESYRADRAKMDAVLNRKRRALGKAKTISGASDFQASIDAYLKKGGKVTLLPECPAEYPITHYEHDDWRGGLTAVTGDAITGEAL